MRLLFLVIASAIATSVVFAASIPLIKRDAASDRRVLNFSLSLEHLEAEFYKQGLERYDTNGFVHAGLSHKVHYRFTQISAHEFTHVATLETTIKNMGGTPVPPCKYKFPVENVYDFVAIA
ncbi:hypothetical protein BGZ51_006801 [Haplosporangium sp. Z 767]|nr:hypothetical protein BGZ50_000315 [Haplosporangium sp. Z 11]KAF9191745.1 hypothetical protein BGZ51_006801 [Haplosporangium sp. Z 767]